VQYMLLIYGSETAWESRTDDERAAMYEEYHALDRELRELRAFVSSQELRPTETATSVRVRDGETLVTDGPFAETREALGGYYVIEAASIDEAIEWAAKIPSAREGTIEIRPVVREHEEVGA
jgi:hypothetical protein